jgi:hypothetical protein
MVTRLGLKHMHPLKVITICFVIVLCVTECVYACVNRSS